MQNAASKKSSAHRKPTAQVGSFSVSSLQESHSVQSAVVFLSTLFIYALTTAHTVTFEDSGLFILSGYYWGVPHPPGYPLFSLLSHLLTWLPLDTVAFRVHLLSILCGAASGVVMYRIFYMIAAHKWLSVALSLVVAFASTLWAQMIIAEVYAFNYFLSLLCLYLTMRIHEKGELATTRLFFLTGSVGALALANHWPIFVISGPAFLFYIDKNWRQRRKILALLGGFSLAIIPYLLMWWRSQQNPEISFLGEINSFTDLYKYIARSYYAATDVSVLHTWRDVMKFYATFFERIFYRDFIVLLAPLFFIGLYHAYITQPKRRFYSFLYLMCTTSLILPWRLKLEFNILNENVFSVFWLLPFFAYGYFLLQGALCLEQRKRYTGLALVAVSAFGNLLINFKENNLRNDHFAEYYGRIILKSVPENRGLVVSTDSDVGPIAYTNMVLKENPTLKLYTGTGVFFKNSFTDPRRGGVERRYQATVDFVKQNSPVYSVKGLNIFEGRRDLPITVNFNGVVYKYSSYVEATEPISPEVLALTKDALTHYVENLGLNNWPYHRGTLAARLCNILVLMGIEDHIAFEKAPVCQQVLARHLTATGRLEQADKMFMGWISQYKNPIVSEKQQYVYHFMINRLQYVNSLRNQPEKQQELLKEMLPIVEQVLFDYPLCENLAYPVVNSFKNQIKISPEAEEQLKVFAKCGNPRR